MRFRHVRGLHRARRRPLGARLPDARQALTQNARIVTLEGLGTPDRPHPVQTAFITEQALQCGYCTNGMIMEAAALLADKPNPTEPQIRQRMNANLCRCGRDWHSYARRISASVGLGLSASSAAASMIMPLVQ